MHNTAAKLVRFSGLLQSLKLNTEKLRFKMLQNTYSSLENHALQHFQDTQARSDMYIQIYSSNRDLKEYISFTEEKVAFYKPNLRRIIIGKPFQETPPAQQYMSILREYRHHLQYLNDAKKMSLLSLFFNMKNQNLTQEEKKFYPEKILNTAMQQEPSSLWCIHEHDADHFAIEHISCPTCLKIIQSKSYHIQNSDGYFNPEDIEPFIQAASNDLCCPAHTKTPGDDHHNFIIQQLEEKLAEFNQKMSFTSSFCQLFLFLELTSLEHLSLIKEIEELDKQSGNLLQHIPNYNRDFIRKITEEKKFQELLSAKLLKDLDVRQTMAKTELQSQKGEFPLIEEHKLNQ